MIKNKYNVVGVMSGTSLDGVDYCWVEFSKNKHWSFKILAAETVSYSTAMKTQLSAAISLNSNELNQLNQDYTKYLGHGVNAFIQKHSILNLDAVCSHGHTVLHQPEKGLTLQIGNLPKLADYIQQMVVCDFRVQDVALGGQGAPLVPIGDALLFSQYDYCLNLGGFANVSFKKGSKRIAYDICPVNIVLNKYAQKIGLEYDDRGKVAAKGNYIEELDVQLQKLHFYKEQAPKSLGLEWVKEKVFPKIDDNINKPEEVLRTFTDHVAWAIAREFPKEAKVLVTGGGAYNDYLIQKIKSIKNIDLIIPSKKIIDFKEALIFAFLGVLKLDNQVNCLCSVTGAEKNHSSGVVVNPSMAQ